MKLPMPLAMALQAGFNNYLALDPEARPGFDRLSGKLVLFHFSGIELDVYFLVHPDRVEVLEQFEAEPDACLLYTSPSPRDRQKSRMPSSA